MKYEDKIRKAFERTQEVEIEIETNPEAGRNGEDLFRVEINLDECAYREAILSRPEKAALNEEGFFIYSIPEESVFVLSRGGRI